ncbi:thioredoxin reductase [mine drainage metagenome]|uniref:Thioredoxin reductase n=1 Tax=mine drainage metagenome TaxID=410659 RepID=A0A1J5RZ04_9ZZZZ
MPQFDLLIVGAGVAGLTAAATAARYGLKLAVVESIGAGGQVMNIDRIENFPGFPQGVSGYELGPLLQEQAEAVGAEFLLDTIEGLEVSGKERILVGAEGRISALSVVIAAGSGKRPLGVPGEKRLTGHGVSHCASCDGPLFKKSDVCVVGGGDSALDEALALAKHARQVTIIHRGRAFSAQQCLVDRLSAAENVEVVLETEVQEILGEETVSSISLRNLHTGEVSIREAEGVFIYVGLTPLTSFLSDLLRLDATGHIETDVMMRTSLAGVFAAGDIRAGSVAQLAAAAGDGVTAAVSAYRYVVGLS